MIVFRFLKELYRWIRYGHQYRSKKDMEKIYKICRACPNFREEGGWLDGYDQCSICGCNLHPSKRIVNKIAWNTTSCPDSPPRWVAEINSEGSSEPPF